GAPNGGAAVTLTSSAPTVVVPAVVVVPTGATSQTFTIATTDAPPNQTVTITATYGGESQSTTLTVWAHPIVNAFSCSPAGVSGGATLQCVGTLSNSAPGGWTLGLATDNSAASVPGTLTVGPGATTFQFAVTTTAVSAATTVTIQVADAPTGLVVWRELVTIN